MRFLLTTICLYLLSCVPALSNDDPGAVRAQMAREPWQWSDEERYEARRKKLAELETRSITDKSQKVSRTIHGSENPELFLPIELFRDFVFVRYIAPNEQFRESAARRYSEAIPYEGFIERVEACAKEWIDLGRAREEKIAVLVATSNASDRRSLEQQLEASERQELCALHASLSCAYASIGREILNQFLYEVIAPERFVTDLAPSSAEAISQLRRWTRGCK